MATFLLWAGIIVMLGGAANLWWVLRESRVGAHPTCRGCGYDLRGVWRRVWQCPECGGDVRIVQRGEWKFDWRITVGPVLLILLGLCLGGVGLAPRLHRALATPPLPSSAYLTQTLSFDRKLAAAAFAELRKRRDNNELTAADALLFATRLGERAKVEKLVRNLPASARTLGEARAALSIWRALIRLGVAAPKPAVDERYLADLEKDSFEAPDPGAEPEQAPDSSAAPPLRFDVY
jgi:hypothetical protein